MDVWDNDDFDLAEPAYITFEGDNDGSFAFVAVSGELDVRYGSRDACAEFTWDGFDDAKRPRRHADRSEGCDLRPDRSGLRTVGRG